MMNRAGRWGTLLGLGLLALSCWRAPEPEPAEQSPETIAATATRRELLGFRPEGTVVAVAFPPLRSWYAKSMALARRAAPEGFDVDAWAAARREQLADDFGVEDVETFFDIAHALGLNPEAPSAVFVGSRRNDEEQPPPVTYLGQVRDRSVAVDALSRVALFEGEPVEEIAVGDVVVRKGADSNAAYFIYDDYAVFSTLSEMVIGVAERFADPAEVKYGTPGCPAGGPDEIAALVEMSQLDIIRPFIQRFAPMDVAADTNDGSEHPVAELASQYTAGDPAVVTALWGDGGIEILYRLDGEAHPEIAAKHVSPAPLTLAPRLPAASEAILGLRFTEEGLANLERRWLALVPDSVKSDPLYKSAESQLGQTLAIIGEELAIGMMGVEMNQPQLMALIRVRQPSEAANLFGAFGPVFQEQDRYDGVSIQGLPPEMDIPLSYAIRDGILVLGPSALMVKGGLTQLDGENVGPLFRGLDPPIDPTVPRETLVVLPQSLIVGLVLPLASDAVSAPAMVAAQSLAQEFREVRIFQEFAGEWRISRFQLIP